MAYDKVVDSTQLDSDLTSVANAIRTKSGGSGQLAFPSGFVSEIGNISDTPKWAKYMRNINYMFYNKTFTETSCVFDFDGATMTSRCDGAFSGTNLEQIVIKNLILSNQIFITAFYGMSNLKSLTFENCIIAPSMFDNAFRYSTALEEINGEIDFSNLTGSASYLFGICTSLTHIEPKPNSLSYSTHGWDNSPFDNDTLVCIGNALDPTATGQTLTLRSAQKANCITIMGTNNSGTFVADAQGTLSLADFITNVKGWTLA